MPIFHLPHFSNTRFSVILTIPFQRLKSNTFSILIPSVRSVSNIRKLEVFYEYKHIKYKTHKNHQICAHLVGKILKIHLHKNSSNTANFSNFSNT
jgi:hypothetical protein